MLQQATINYRGQTMQLNYQVFLKEQWKISSIVNHGIVEMYLPLVAAQKDSVVVREWINCFLKKHASTIGQLLSEYRRYKKFHLTTNTSIRREDFIFLKGVKFFFKFINQPQQPSIVINYPTCVINHPQLAISIAPEANYTQQMWLRKKIIYRLLKPDFLNYVSERLSFWRQKIIPTFSEQIKIKMMLVKSYWAKVLLRADGEHKCKIHINQILMHFSPDTIDYVLIHELIHIAHPEWTHGRFMASPTDQQVAFCRACAEHRSYIVKKDSLFFQTIRRYCPDFYQHLHLLNHINGVDHMMHAPLKKVWIRPN